MVSVPGKVAAQSVGKYSSMGQTVNTHKPPRGTGAHPVKVNETKRQRMSMDCSATVASSSCAEQEVDSVDSGLCQSLLKRIFSAGSTQCLEVRGEGSRGFVVNDAFMECIRRQQEQQQKRIEFLELENQYLRNCSGLGDVGLGFPVEKEKVPREQ